MSILREKWSVDDIREIIQNLDMKTGKDGAFLPIILVSVLGTDGKAIAEYYPGDCFIFSRKYFDDKHFRDSAAIDAIRHVYCHYLVHRLKLDSSRNVFGEEYKVHGAAWKYVCSYLRVDDSGAYTPWHFGWINEKELVNLVKATDIEDGINILEKLIIWGTEYIPFRRRDWLEKELVKKYTKAGLFEKGDEVIHPKHGHGVVLDTFPTENKQLLCVRFDNGSGVKVQNRHVYKVQNGQMLKKCVKRPAKPKVYE